MVAGVAFGRGMHPAFFWKHPKECAVARWKTMPAGVCRRQPPAGQLLDGDKDIGGLSERRAPQSLKREYSPHWLGKKSVTLNRSAAMSVSRVELPTPLNNCPSLTVLTSVSSREYSLRSRRCCGGHRRAGRPRPAVDGHSLCMFSRGSPAQRVPWEKDEQRNERAFGFNRKREICKLARTRFT